MAEQPVLVCTRGSSLLGERFSVPEGGLSIGRAEDNQICIQDEGVSRYHVRMLFNSESGKLWLEDAGSRNGVFVNESRVSGHKELKVGDEIIVAEHAFVIRWQDEAPSEDAGGTEDDRMEDPASKRRWFWPFS